MATSDEQLIRSLISYSSNFFIPLGAMVVPILTEASCIGFSRTPSLWIQRFRKLLACAFPFVNCEWPCWLHVAVSWFRRKRLLQRSRAATDAGGYSSRCVNCLKSTLFSTKLCLGMVSVAEIRNVSVLLSNMLRVHKEQISDLSNNLSVACRYIFLL